MINFDAFFNRQEFQTWRSHFEATVKIRSAPQRHGDLNAWLSHLDSLPDIHASSVDLTSDTIRIGQASDASNEQLDQLHTALYALCPWRKGPFQFFDTFIDTEWRSDWKWQRLEPHISNLHDRQVLDIGCGTGYHAWRMLGAGANYVLGIDPSMRFLVQYLCAQKYIKSASFDFLPIGVEDLPDTMTAFDTVFSMGILYHRRQPQHHLEILRKLLNPDGELVLETLVMDSEQECVVDGYFAPQERYAQMRNVWSIMSIEKILELLEQAGFSAPRCVDVHLTSRDEQRSTPWMSFHSLKEFLDPNDVSKTIEGYPAPKRAVFIAQK